VSTTPYAHGQTVRLPAADIRDGDGQAADPISLDLTIWLPDGTTTTVPISGLTRGAVGSWYYDYLPPTDGRYAYRFEAIGPTVAVDGAFVVAPSPFLADGPMPGWPGAYLTVAEFLATPEGSAVTSEDLVPGGSAAQQRAALATLLLRASEHADSITLVPLGAHQVVEHQDVLARADGTILFAPRQVSGSIPLITVSQFGYGPGAATVTSLTPTASWVQDSAAVIPLGAGAWSGALRIGAPPRGARVHVQVTYTAGFPCTTLTAPAATGALELAVDDAVGIMSGRRLRLHDPGREEQVTVAAAWTPTVGPAALPLAAALRNDHPLGTGVADMPMDIKTAVAQIAAHLIRRPTDTGTSDAFGGGKTPAVDVTAGGDQVRGYQAARATLDRYARSTAD